MTNTRRSATGEIDMERDLISPDLGYDEVVHILRKPISTETVHIRRDLEDIGTGLPPRNQGNTKIAHFLGRTRLGTQSPWRKVSLPKNPLKFIDIGPLFALVKKIMMITPLTMGYK